MPSLVQTIDSSSSNDICPVCKSSRYLNPNMKFLVNPSCYHRMCLSCVDRIFSHGPAPCPVAGCKQTLRKNRFREQRFEDIRVEREVDIRRDVAATMRRQEVDFEGDLRAYNDWLEMVETVTFELIEGDEKGQKWARERLDEERARNKTVDAERAKAARNGQDAHSLDNASFDPFGGVAYDPQYYAPDGQYTMEWMDKLKADPTFLAGGYSLDEYSQHSLVDAFSGLGVVVAEERSAA